MTDETLMEAVSNGELDKASVLFERYHKRIFNFLFRMTGDREEAEDLTQNVFLRMIRYRTSFRDGSMFLPWIYQVARNVFSDHYQKHKSRKSTHMDIEKVRDEIADTTLSVYDAEKEAILFRCMEMLPEDQRELLVLTRFQHMKYEEVAQIMDTTVANIKVRVHRAIARLREYYFELDKV